VGWRWKFWIFIEVDSCGGMLGGGGEIEHKVVYGT
jgi:hypothetical protein